MKQHKLLSLLFLIPLFSSAIIYEDAEDGKTTGWHIYDRWPSGAKVENVVDNKQGRVIQITGTASNGVQLIGWNDKETTLEWKMKADSWNVFYVAVETTKGFRYLCYTPRDYDKGRNPNNQSDKIRLGLGSEMQDGQWHTFRRNLQVDITKHEKGNKLLKIYGIKVRGAGYYDDIKTLSSSNKKVITLTQLKAFPTAEGAGAIASGGRGGQVVYVTNRRATGEGSLQWALTRPFQRTIVFAIGGRFNLDEEITLGSKKHDNNPDIDYNLGDFTLAGQTANDKGGVHLANNIDLIDYTGGANHFNVYNQRNMILRYFDSRFNWSWYPKKGKLGKEPSIRFSHVSNLILDHITSGWSSYGLIISNSNVREHEATFGNITVQRSLFHENIANPDRSTLMEGIDPKEYQRVHNVGLLLGKDPCFWKWDKVNKVLIFHSTSTKEQWDDMGEFTIHKNAFIGLSHRFPNTSGGEGGKFRFTNNYIYGFKGDDTGQRLARIAGTSQNDIIGNVYQLSKYSPDFNKTNLYGYLDNETFDGHISKANIHIRDNLYLNNNGSEHIMTQKINDNPYLMFHNRRGGSNKLNRGETLTSDTAILRENPIPSSAYPLSILSTDRVKENLLENIGGNIQFDANGTAHVEDPIDRLYIAWAKENAGPDHFASMDDTEDETTWGVGNSKRFKYPKSYNADTKEDVNASILDHDLDGIPDAWEKIYHLDPEKMNNNAVHAKWEIGNYIIENKAGYTDLEIYLADIGGDFHMLAEEEE